MEESNRIYCELQILDERRVFGLPEEGIIQYNTIQNFIGN